MKEIIDFQPTFDAEPTSTGIEVGASAIKGFLTKEQLIASAEIPPAPTDGTPDTFGALRVWASRETGQFSGDRHHHQPGDPGYNGQQEG